MSLSTLAWCSCSCAVVVLQLCCSCVAVELQLWCSCVALVLHLCCTCVAVSVVQLGLSLSSECLALMMLLVVLGVRGTVSVFESRVLSFDCKEIVAVVPQHARFHLAFLQVCVCDVAAVRVCDVAAVRVMWRQCVYVMWRQCSLCM